MTTRGAFVALAALEALTGVVFIGFGIRLVTEHH